MHKSFTIVHLQWNAKYNEFLNQFDVATFAPSTMKQKLGEFLAHDKQQQIIDRNNKTLVLRAIVEPEARLPGSDADGVLGRVHSYCLLLPCILISHP